MADFEHWQWEIGLEFVRWSSAERKNFNEGSSKPKKDVQVIRVWGAMSFRTRITCFQSVCQYST